MPAGVPEFLHFVEASIHQSPHSRATGNGKVRATPQGLGPRNSKRTLKVFFARKIKKQFSRSVKPYGMGSSI